MRVIHKLTQGSDAWIQHRTRCFNASEVCAVMGASKYTTRSALLREKATGVAPEVAAPQQALYDRGHAAEAAARPLVENMLGDDLAPITASIEVDGMTLGASYDGITLMEDIAWENKLWNEGLVAQMARGELEPHYYWQLEQQLLVTPTLQRIVFTCSDGTAEKFVAMDYRAVPGRREQLIAAWKQFDADLAAYVLPSAAEPVPTGRAPETLPALRIEVTGMVTASNLDAFKQHALAVFGGINTSLRTDNDFADAERTVKWCGDVEDRLAAAKQHALSQTESIEALFRAIDDIAAEARRVRLDLSNKVKAKKEERRGEIVAAGVTALREHCAGLTKRLGRPYLPAITADFGGVIKGKKSLSSMEDAVATELARAKIEANRVADLIDGNLRTMEALAGSYTGMFPDAAGLVLKSAEDCEATVRLRVDAHEKRLAAERERIRAEEAARADREHAARLAREQAVLATPAPTAAPTPAPAPVANVVPMQRPPSAPVAPTAQPTLRLGQINERLAPIALTADGLAALGFPFSGTDKAAKLYHEHQFHGICAAIAQHAVAAANRLQAA